MTQAKSDFIQVCKERGFFHQCTDEDDLSDLLDNGGIRAYIGFDCTAKSLHVGSLMQIMVLRWFQKCGHHPVVLMGGGTTKVGDPSGKDESRKLLSDDDIKDNMAGIKRVFAKYIDFNNATMVNNADWLEQLNYIEFLRDYGRHFSVNRMLSMDSVKLRIEREQHLSFLEFNYMILQAYDFVELNKRHNVRLQIGGSDQWGNIVSGVELQRRLNSTLMKETISGSGGYKKRDEPVTWDKTKELFGLTTPLLTTSSGAKMGKTASGAVWLDAEMLSPYDYWQYWRNIEDADVGRFLRLFTELPISEIEKLEKLQGAELNEAKKILANEVTSLCHGKEEAARSAETARKVFESGESAGDLPTVEISAAALAAGIPAHKIFVDAGLCASGGEARRLIRGNGARVNDNVVTDENMNITSEHATSGQIKLSSGRKKHVLVKTV